MSCSGDGTTLIDRNDDPHISSSLGRILLKSVLAEGVTGRIYRSGDAAVRVLYGDFGTQELVIKRMFRDVEAAKELQHPNVARILDAGTDDGSTWIAWELANGRTLEEMIESGEPFRSTRRFDMRADGGGVRRSARLDLLHRNLSRTQRDDRAQGKRPRRGEGARLRPRLAVALFSGDAVPTRVDYCAAEALKPSGASKAADVFRSA